MKTKKGNFEIILFTAHILDSQKVHLVHLS
jgi:hypothetical protein